MRDSSSARSCMELETPFPGLSFCAEGVGNGVSCMFGGFASLLTDVYQSWSLARAALIRRMASVMFSSLVA